MLFRSDPVWEFDTWTGWIDDGESLLDTALPPTSVDGPYAPEEWDFTAADGWSGDGGGIATGCFLVTSTFDLDLPYLLHETISPQENRFLEIVPSSASTLMMWPSVDYPLTFEYCVLPLPVDLGSVDAEPLADSQLDDFKLDDFRPDADIQATASDTPAPAPVPSTNSIPSNWMAAFATSLPGEIGRAHV